MHTRANPAALKALIEGSGIRYRENRKSWIFDCPRCAKSHRLYLRKTDGRFVCFFCATTIGYQGRAEFALRDLLSLPLFEINLQLYGEGSAHRDTGAALLLPPLSDFFDDPELAPSDLLPLPEQPVSLEFLELSDPMAEKGRQYLRKRGISLHLAYKLGVRYHPKERRVIFPIVVEGRLVGWQARTVEPTEWTDPETGETFKAVKILTSPSGLDRNRCLMFQDNLKGSEHAIVCEGPIDAIQAHKCGGAVATMGKQVSPGQIEIIKESGVKAVYIAVDPDAAAEVNRLCLEFSGLRVYRLTPSPDKEDLGAMTPDGVLERFRSAPRVNTGRIFLPPISTFMA